MSRAASVCRDDFQAGYYIRRAGPVDQLMADAMNRVKPEQA